MTFIFRNRIIFWDILKWNKGQTKWDRGSMILSKTCLTCPADTLKLIYIIDLEENDTNIRVSLWKVTQALEPTKICIVRLIVKDKTYINTLGIIP